MKNIPAKKVATKPGKPVAAALDRAKAIKEKKVKEEESVVPELTAAVDDTALLAHCSKLFKEASKLKRTVDEGDKRLKDIREELVGYAVAYQTNGFRFGDLTLSYSGYRTNQKLSVEKLIENGVTPEQIADSYVESKEFQDSRFIRPKK